MTYQAICGVQAAASIRVRALRHAIRVALVATAACCLLGLAASPALADFGFQAGSVSASLSTSQAGAHPDLTTSFALNLKPDGTPDGNLKDIAVSLPPGIVGNATAVPQCTEDQVVAAGACPAEAQVGVLTTTILFSGTFPVPISAPLYNMVPAPGSAAELGAVNFLIGTYLKVSVRSDNYGLMTVSRDIPDFSPVVGVSVTLWGVPADHNGATGAPRRAFLTNPTDCAATTMVEFSADSWQNQGQFATDEATLPPFTGCDRLPDIHPVLSAGPGTAVAGEPSGFDIDLAVPQVDNPDGIATPAIKMVSVTLPEGVAISPAAAEGLEACTDGSGGTVDEIGLGQSSAPTCPNASKVGTVSITTPLLPNPLTGSVYVAQPKPDDPYRLYLVAEGPGVMIKLLGSVMANGQTGQLTATFDDTPPLPFSSLHVHLKGGSRALLSNPSTCGTFTSTATLTPYGGGADGIATSPFDISRDGVGGACPASLPFAPTFTAGVTNIQAGSFSPFVLSFSRSDTDQYLSSLSVKLPPGELAKLAGVQECSDAQLAAAASKSGAAEQSSPSCPVGSQVGSVETGSGAGADPLFLPGKAYLTGPYKGGPYGLAEVIPAVAGPYDLGTVVVRQALHIDPTTAQVTAVSDPFPTILKGIPLRLRRVDVDLNRPDFMVNPTSCDVMAVTGTLSSTLGINAPVSSRFQVGGCASLKFSPKLRMKLTGKGRTRSGDHPTLVATVTQRRGQANIHNVRVALPLSLALDPNNSQHVCSYAIAQAVTTGPANCPASTLVGHATAITPLLSQPLTGPVYLVQGIRYSHGQPIHTLPSLLIPLRGQIALDLRAQTSVSRGKLVSTFATIPDAAVSKFTLTINGGKKGILVITGRGRTICGSPQVTRAALVGQNGKAVYPNIRMGTLCRVSHHKRRK